MRMQPFLKAWFDYPEDPDKSRFEIKHMRAGEITEIVDQTHKQRFEFVEELKPGATEPELVPKPIIETRKSQEQVLTIIEAITDWEKVFDEEGEILPCTTESKKELCAKISEKDFTELALFVQDCRKQLAIQQKEAEARRRGN